MPLKKQRRKQEKECWGVAVHGSSEKAAWREMREWATGCLGGKTLQVEGLHEAFSDSSQQNKPFSFSNANGSLFTPFKHHASLSLECALCLYLPRCPPWLLALSIAVEWIMNYLQRSCGLRKHKSCISNLFNLLTIKPTLSTWMVCVKVR